MPLFGDEPPMSGDGVVVVESDWDSENGGRQSSYRVGSPGLPETPAHTGPRPMLRMSQLNQLNDYDDNTDYTHNNHHAQRQQRGDGVSKEWNSGEHTPSRQGSSGRGGRESPGVIGLGPHFTRGSVVMSPGMDESDVLYAENRRSSPLLRQVDVVQVVEELNEVWRAAAGDSQRDRLYHGTLNESAEDDAAQRWVNGILRRFLLTLGAHGRIGGIMGTLESYHEERMVRRAKLLELTADAVTEESEMRHNLQQEVKRLELENAEAEAKIRQLSAHVERRNKALSQQRTAYLREVAVLREQLFRADKGEGGFGGGVMLDQSGTYFDDTELQRILTEGVSQVADDARVEYKKKLKAARDELRADYDRRLKEINHSHKREVKSLRREIAGLKNEVFETEEVMNVSMLSVDDKLAELSEKATLSADEVKGLQELIRSREFEHSSDIIAVRADYENRLEELQLDREVEALDFRTQIESLTRSLEEAQAETERTRQEASINFHAATETMRHDIADLTSELLQLRAAGRRAGLPKSQALSPHRPQKRRPRSSSMSLFSDDGADSDGGGGSVFVKMAMMEENFKIEKAELIAESALRTERLSMLVEDLSHQLADARDSARMSQIEVDAIMRELKASNVKVNRVSSQLDTSLAAYADLANSPRPGDEGEGGSEDGSEAGSRGRARSSGAVSRTSRASNHKGDGDGNENESERVAELRESVRELTDQLSSLQISAHQKHEAFLKVERERDMCMAAIRGSLGAAAMDDIRAQVEFDHVAALEASANSRTAELQSALQDTNALGAAADDSTSSSSSGDGGSGRRASVGGELGDGVGGSERGAGDDGASELSETKNNNSDTASIAGSTDRGEGSQPVLSRSSSTVRRPGSRSAVDDRPGSRGSHVSRASGSSAISLTKRELAAELSRQRAAWTAERVELTARIERLSSLAESWGAERQRLLGRITAAELMARPSNASLGTSAGQVYDALLASGDSRIGSIGGMAGVVGGGDGLQSEYSYYSDDEAGSGDGSVVGGASSDDETDTTLGGLSRPVTATGEGAGSAAAAFTMAAGGGRGVGDTGSDSTVVVPSVSGDSGTVGRGGGSGSRTPTPPPPKVRRRRSKKHVPAAAGSNQSGARSARDRIAQRQQQRASGTVSGGKFTAGGSYAADYVAALGGPYQPPVHLSAALRASTRAPDRDLKRRNLANGVGGALGTSGGAGGGGGGGVGGAGVGSDDKSRPRSALKRQGSGLSKSTRSVQWTDTVAEGGGGGSGGDHLSPSGLSPTPSLGGNSDDGGSTVSISRAGLSASTPVVSTRPHSVSSLYSGASPLSSRPSTAELAVDPSGAKASIRNNVSVRGRQALVDSLLNSGLLAGVSEDHPAKLSQSGKKKKRRRRRAGADGVDSDDQTGWVDESGSAVAGEAGSSGIGAVGDNESDGSLSRRAQTVGATETRAHGDGEHRPISQPLELQERPKTSILPSIRAPSNKGSSGESPSGGVSVEQERAHKKKKKRAAAVRRTKTGLVRNEDREARLLSLTKRTSTFVKSHTPRFLLDGLAAFTIDEAASGLCVFEDEAAIGRNQAGRGSHATLGAFASEHLAAAAGGRVGEESSSSYYSSSESEASDAGGTLMRHRSRRRHGGGDSARSGGGGGGGDVEELESSWEALPLDSFAGKTPKGMMRSGNAVYHGLGSPGSPGGSGGRMYSARRRLRNAGCQTESGPGGLGGGGGGVGGGGGALCTVQLSQLPRLAAAQELRSQQRGSCGLTETTKADYLCHTAALYDSLRLGDRLGIGYRQSGGDRGPSARARAACVRSVLEETRGMLPPPVRPTSAPSWETAFFSIADEEAAAAAAAAAAGGGTPGGSRTIGNASRANMGPLGRGRSSVFLTSMALREFGFGGGVTADDADVWDVMSQLSAGRPLSSGPLSSELHRYLLLSMFSVETGRFVPSKLGHGPPPKSPAFSKRSYYGSKLEPSEPRWVPAGNTNSSYNNGYTEPSGSSSPGSRAVTAGGGSGSLGRRKVLPALKRNSPGRKLRPKTGVPLRSPARSPGPLEGQGIKSPLRSKSSSSVKAAAGDGPVTPETRARTVTALKPLLASINSKQYQSPVTGAFKKPVPVSYSVPAVERSALGEVDVTYITLDGDGESSPGGGRGRGVDGGGGGSVFVTEGGGGGGLPAHPVLPSAGAVGSPIRGGHVFTSASRGGGGGGPPSPQLGDIPLSPIRAGGGGRGLTLDSSVGAGGVGGSGSGSGGSGGGGEGGVFVMAGNRAEFGGRPQYEGNPPSPVSPHFNDVRL